MTDENRPTDARTARKNAPTTQAIDRTLRQDVVVHLIGGAADADVLAEEVATDRDLNLVTVECDSDTTDEAIPAARLPEDVLVYYADFGELSSEVQVTAAQRIKGQFEFGTPVIVNSSEDARGDLTLRNGDLVGRVRAVELDDSTTATRSTP